MTSKPIKIYGLKQPTKSNNFCMINIYGSFACYVVGTLYSTIISCVRHSTMSKINIGS